MERDILKLSMLEEISAKRLDENSPLGQAA
jgi:hypothetical protein